MSSRGSPEIGSASSPATFFGGTSYETGALLALAIVGLWAPMAFAIAFPPMLVDRWMGAGSRQIVSVAVRRSCLQVNIR